MLGLRLHADENIEIPADVLFISSLDLKKSRILSLVCGLTSRADYHWHGGKKLLQILCRSVSEYAHLNTCTRVCVHTHTDARTVSRGVCLCVPLPPQHLSPLFCPPALPCSLLSLLPASSISSAYPGETGRTRESEGEWGGESRQDLEFKCTCRKEAE